MQQFLIEFKHDSKFLGFNGLGLLLVEARSFEEACDKIARFSVKKVNSVNGYEWKERFKNARDFVNLTILGHELCN